MNLNMKKSSDTPDHVPFKWPVEITTLYGINYIKGNVGVPINQHQISYPKENFQGQRLPYGIDTKTELQNVSTTGRMKRSHMTRS